jgi:predicted CopG family antitoxin
MGNSRDSQRGIRRTNQVKVMFTDEEFEKLKALKLHPQDNYASIIRRAVDEKSKAIFVLKFIYPDKTNDEILEMLEDYPYQSADKRVAELQIAC